MTAVDDANRAPSLLLQAFTRYLRNRPGDDDTKSIRAFNDGQALEGISGYSSNLGGVPAITLEPLVGEPKRIVVYYHGGGYISGSPPDRSLPLAGAVALAAQARVHVVDYRLAPDNRFPAAFDDCLAAYRWTVRDGGENNLHYHLNSTTNWMVLRGRARFYGVGDVLLAELGPEQSIMLPGGSRYRFEKVGEQNLEILQMVGVDLRGDGDSGRINVEPHKEWMTDKFLQRYEEPATSEVS